MISVAPVQADLVPPPPPPISDQPPTMERPKDDRVVEQMFYEMMHKRGAMNAMPPGVQEQLFSYPTDKKWLMVYQDKLTEWQNEQKKRQNGDYGSAARGEPDTDSPEWYVKKIMDGSITAKQLSSLAVSLRTQPIS